MSSTTDTLGLRSNECSDGVASTLNTASDTSKPRKEGHADEVATTLATAVDNLHLESKNIPTTGVVELSTTLIGSSQSVSVTVRKQQGTSRYRRSGNPYVAVLYVPDDAEFNLFVNCPLDCNHSISYNTSTYYVQWYQLIDANMQSRTIYFT